MLHNVEIGWLSIQMLEKHKNALFWLEIPPHSVYICMYVGGHWRHSHNKMDQVSPLHTCTCVHFAFCKQWEGLGTELCWLITTQMYILMLCSIFFLFILEFLPLSPSSIICSYSTTYILSSMYLHFVISKMPTFILTIFLTDSLCLPLQLMGMLSPCHISSSAMIWWPPRRLCTRYVNTCWERERERERERIIPWVPKNTAPLSKLPPPFLIPKFLQR